MRVVVLVLIGLLLASVSAREGGEVGQGSEAEREIPTTLAEAHAELERIFSAEELAKIDAMESEGGMVQYHLPFGAGLRNRWGLWQGSALARHMQALGIDHPDAMSGVILGTFWCKRHGEDFRLEERAAAYKKSMEAARKAQAEEERIMQEAEAAVRDIMMGLRFEKRDVPVVQIPIRDDPSVRFMCPFRDGVFLTCCLARPLRKGPVLQGGYYVDPATGENRRRPDMDDSVSRGLYLGIDPEARGMGRADSFHTLGFYLDLEERRFRRIQVPEVSEIYASVVAEERAWFAGLTNGIPVLIGIGDRDRVTARLPQADEIPDLGLDGQLLLAAYSNAIYRLVGDAWEFVHSGDILLPRSGLPPRRYGDTVFLRDEGTRDPISKNLWWLTLGERPHLSVLQKDVGGLAHGGPAWSNVFSYCVTNGGEFWACVGMGSRMNSLVRRAQDGTYSVAILDNSVRSTDDPARLTAADGEVSVSAVTSLSNGTLLLAGHTGLYRLKGNELVQELAFGPARVTDSAGFTRRLDWLPTQVLVLDDRSYLMGSGYGRGVYLLRQDDAGQWTCLPLPLGWGDPVMW